MDKDEEPTVFHPIERVAKDGKPRTDKRCRKVFIVFSTLLRQVPLLSLAQHSETPAIFFLEQFLSKTSDVVF
jgi:hypothetical protein